MGQFEVILTCRGRMDVLSFHQSWDGTHLESRETQVKRWRTLALNKFHHMVVATGSIPCTIYAIYYIHHISIKCGADLTSSFAK